MKIESKNVVTLLNNLKGIRTTQEKIESFLSEWLETPIKLEEASHNDLSEDDYDDGYPTDYEFVVLFDNGEIYCDIDIYFLKMRRPDLDGNTIYITEIGYEFD